MGFSASVVQKMELEPKNEGGGGEGVFFLSSSLPPRSFACPMFFFFMTLIPHSFLRNHTEMLAMQFTVEVEPPESIPNAQIWWTFVQKKSSLYRINLLIKILLFYVYF